MFSKYKEGWGGQQGKKQAQMTHHLGLMYVFFFSYIFFVTNTCVIGYTY